MKQAVKPRIQAFVCPSDSKCLWQTALSLMNHWALSARAGSCVKCASQKTPFTASAKGLTPDWVPLSQSTGPDNLWADRMVHWRNTTPPPQLTWLRNSYSESSQAVRICRCNWPEPAVRSRPCEVALRLGLITIQQPDSNQGETCHLASFSSR